MAHFPGWHSGGGYRLEVLSEPGLGLCSSPRGSSSKCWRSLTTWWLSSKTELSPKNCAEAVLFCDLAEAT